MAFILRGPLRRATAAAKPFAPAMPRTAVGGLDRRAQLNGLFYHFPGGSFQKPFTGKTGTRKNRGERTMTSVRNLCTSATVALMTLALAGPASALGLGGPFGGHYGNPGSQPNRQCLQNCQQTDRLCLVSARNDAQTCAQSTCAAQGQAAQDACATDFTSTDCQNALSAWKTCLQPCRSTFRTAIGSCLSAAQTCKGTCASVTPTPQPDPQCVSGCRSSLSSCTLSAATTAQGCDADCKPLITTAEQTCATAPFGSGCRTALQGAFACLEPCQQAQRMASQQCLQTAQSCVAACPSATP